MVSRIREKYGLSERHACRIISQPRGTQRYVPTLRADEDALTQAIIALACKEAAISEQSYFRWRKEYGGLQIEQAKRLKDLGRENSRLRRLVADLSLGKQILKDAASGR